MRRLVLILGALLVAGTAWYVWSLRAVDASDDVRRQVTVAKGMSTREIAEMLEEQKLIRSPTAFVLHAYLNRSEGGLQAGDFYLRGSMSVPEVVTALRRGFAEELTITVPEGFTVADIDALLVEKQLIKAGELQECARTCEFAAFPFLPAAANLAPRGGRLEGYLFPDTYFVIRESFDAKSFLERMLTTFKQRVADGMSEDVRRSKRSLHDIVIMASLVEEETRTDAERAPVAGILWKRLESGISLGVDAAVRYIVDKPSAAITKADLDVDSPYNLRKYTGLAPGPIANPGLTSIRAALHPEETPYLFYLHDAQGVIRYARTNDEHNENRRKYLQ